MPSTSPNKASIRNASFRGVWPVAVAAPSPTRVTAAAPTSNNLRIGSLSANGKAALGWISYGPTGDEIVADPRFPDKISVIGGWEAVSLKG
jgi:hypothetical protein